MKILLVVPRYVRFQGEQYSFPLGLGYIAAALKGAGHTVRGLNLNHDYRPSSDVIAEAIADFDPDACGTGTLSPLYPQANQIFTAARAAKPDIINIAGGGMISSGPEIAARVLDFDFGVIGEGEESTVELADALNHGRDPRQVPGLVLRDRQGATTLTAPRDPIRAIDDLPWPDYEAFGIREWFALVRERAIQMIASRSCPLSCSFCFHPSGRTYRVRNLDRFFKEFDHLNRAYGVTTLSLNDELFALNTDRIREFCTRIKPYGVQWNLALHVHSVDAETLEMMRDSGCSLISYGVESVNADVLKSMRKNATRADIERTLRMTHEKNIEVQGNLIFGDCAETIETVNDSLHWWGENRDLQINLIMLKVYPGSRIFEDAVADGRIADGVAQLIEPGRNFSKLDDASHAALLNRIMEFNETPADAGTGRAVRTRGRDPSAARHAVCDRLALPAMRHLERKATVPDQQPAAFPDHPHAVRPLPGPLRYPEHGPPPLGRRGSRIPVPKGGGVARCRTHRRSRGHLQADPRHAVRKPHLQSPRRGGQGHLRSRPPDPRSRFRPRRPRWLL